MRIIIITFTISVFSFYLLVFTFALILLPSQGATDGSLNHLGRCPRLVVFWPFRPPEDSNIAIFYLARSSWCLLLNRKRDLSNFSILVFTFYLLVFTFYLLVSYFATNNFFSDIYNKDGVYSLQYSQTLKNRG